VDIGIGLLVLTELHERQSGEPITNEITNLPAAPKGY
jgi:hypothetical protein